MYLYISFYFLYLVLTTPRQCHPWGCEIDVRSPILFADLQVQLATFQQGMIWQGSYMYMDHLQALNLYTNPIPQSPEILPSAVYTPLDAQQWAHDLQFHPDKRFSSYMDFTLVSELALIELSPFTLLPQTCNLLTHKSFQNT